MTDFERFWLAYPKKLSRIDALKAWGQMKKQWHFDTDKALAVVDAQKKSKEWTKDGGQFIPHAGTWLRAGGWDNEIEPIRAAGSTSDICRTHGCTRKWVSNYLCSECLKIDRGY